MRKTVAQLEEEIAELRMQKTLREGMDKVLQWQAEHGAIIKRVEQQVILTNGRVTKLEAFRDKAKGAVLVASSVGGAVVHFLAKIIP